MAGLPTLGGNVRPAKKADIRARARKPTRSKRGRMAAQRRVSPHVWRHTTAVHLLEAGVEINVIRAWLGHASLETTNRYAEMTLRTKPDALEKCMVPGTAEERIPRKPLWQTDVALLNWLQSL